MAGCSPKSAPVSGEESTTYQVEINLLGDKNEFPADNQGMLSSEVEVSSADGRIGLSLDKGTTVQNQDGEPLRTIHAAIDPSLSSSPETAYIVSPVYNLEPQGATFNPEIKLTLSYDIEMLPEGIREDDLYIAYYNGNEWHEPFYKKVDTKAHSVTTHLYDFNLTALAILAPKREPAPPSTPTQGTIEDNLAPNFQLKNLEGETVSLSDFKGKPVLINFWATRCPPCVSEMPYLQEIYNEWSETELVLLAINTGESSTKVKQFMQSNDLSLPVLLDTNQDISQEYNIRYIPTTFLIDKKGIIQATKIGAFSSKGEIEEILTKNIT
jgi:peroxiredoxin